MTPVNTESGSTITCGTAVAVVHCIWEQCTLQRALYLWVVTLQLMHYTLQRALCLLHCNLCTIPCIGLCICDTASDALYPAAGTVFMTLQRKHCTLQLALYVWHCNGSTIACSGRCIYDTATAAVDTAFIIIFSKIILYNRTIQCPSLQCIVVCPRRILFIFHNDSAWTLHIWDNKKRWRFWGLYRIYLF